MNKKLFSLPHIFIGLFIISTLFPITASLLDTESPSLWIGITDVILALSVAVLMILIVAKGREKITSSIKEKSFDIYQSLAILPLLLLVMFFLLGESIKWEILLPGLAWRAWAFFYSLPSVIALLRDKS